MESTQSSGAPHCIFCDERTLDLNCGFWRDSVGRTVYISGGMHSDPGARMPVWTGELAEFAAMLPAVEQWQQRLQSTANDDKIASA